MDLSKKTIGQKAFIFLRGLLILFFAKFLNSKNKRITMLFICFFSFIGVILWLIAFWIESLFHANALLMFGLAVTLWLLIAGSYFFYIRFFKKSEEQLPENLKSKNKRFPFINPDLLPFSHKLAINSIQNLHLFVMQTDTVPGIFCHLEDRASAERIFKLKKREQSKPLAIYTSNFAPFIIEEKLSSQFLEYWGENSLTIVLRASSKAPLLAQKEGFVGIRIIKKNHPMALLLKETGASLLGTSANFSGYKEPACITEVSSKILKIAPVIPIGEDLPLSSETSSVIKIDGKKISIIRSGKDIENIIFWIHKTNGVKITDPKKKIQ